MAEALTRVPQNDLDVPVLVNITATDTSLIFYFSNGTTVTENIEPYLTTIISETEAYTLTLLTALINKSPKLNQPAGAEHNGDIKATATTASIFVNGVYRQLYP
jgi:hypothetical protein